MMMVYPARFWFVLAVAVGAGYVLGRFHRRGG
jgi:hypothetical protein